MSATPSVTRRRLLQGSGAVLAGLAVGGCHDANQAQQIASSPTVSPSPPSRATDRPNILVVLADDLGFSDIGCFGAEIRTPNLDALATSGRLFTDMHNNPRCCPSRASLLTGLYPTQTGVGYMNGNEGTPAYQGYLNESCMTLGEALGRSGYRTAISGKWHVAPNSHLEEWPAHRGFERSLLPGRRRRLLPAQPLPGRPAHRHPDRPELLAHHCSHRLRDRENSRVLRRTQTRSSSMSASRTRTSLCRPGQMRSRPTTVPSTRAGTSYAGSVGKTRVRRA